MAKPPAKPLALTLGEPAGIGPDITIAAWLRRRELNLPAFYLLGMALIVALIAVLFLKKAGQASAGGAH